MHKEACEMEHSLSDQAEVALCRFLKHPDRCPDDRKIIPPCGLAFSSCQECLEERADSVGVAVRGPNLVSICELRENDGGKVVFIRGDRKILQRLLDMGLTPGTSISVARVAPLKGPIELAVRGSKLALGQDIASIVFVEATKNNPSVK